MSYHLEGRLLEVCNGKVLCPCWIGEDPDNGTCTTIVAWHIDKGTVDGVDAGGNTIAAVAHVPGNILQGNRTAAIYVDVPGAPVFVGKAPSYRSKNPALGIDLDIKNPNALQSTFVFDA
ncbi:DUF1326 domain-containing protein [Paraburkholderia oxyphila]|uniref:DUF1326 domain-containing protein n=1 Tax=Paraburkholderia oxyphila TaxID=614212 RepID=UPI000489543C|nr:DUF1326 domain-containing protein [Paraburkholderia oxyphila]